MVRGLDGYFYLYPYLACAVFKLHRASRKIPVVHSERETPLPIPNRAVKPFSADGTWGATPWESRSPPVLHDEFEPPSGGSSEFWAPRSRAPPRGRDGKGRGRLGHDPGRLWPWPRRPGVREVEEGAREGRGAVGEVGVGRKMPRTSLFLPSSGDVTNS